MKKQESSLNRRTNSERVFDACNTALVILITLICAYPIYYTIVASFSEPGNVVSGRVFFWPVGFTLESYQEVLKYSAVPLGYRNSILYALFGTAYNLFVLIPASYSLSKKYLKGRKIIMTLCIFTMYFGGGMIPSYLLMKSLNLLNNPLVMILPGAFSVYNMIITRTFFESNFSESLAESARIDGAGELRIFLQLALPLSGSIIAVMALYHLVGHWNSYFNALIYLSKAEYYPLQLVMRQILTTTQNVAAEMDVASTDEMIELARRQYVAQTMKYALVIAANIPVLVAYPFVQKHFVKGVMIGSVKG